VEELEVVSSVQKQPQALFILDGLHILRLAQAVLPELDIDELMGERPAQLAALARKVDENRRDNSQCLDEDGGESDGEQRRCRIRFDFDPTPEVEHLSEGHSRPEQIASVSGNLVRPYDIAKHVQLLTKDHEKVARMTFHERKMRFLASKCVALATVSRDAFFVKDKTSDRWKQFSQANAKAQLKNDWLNCPGYSIGNKTVDTFFKENRYPVLDGIIYVPNADGFLVYRGERRLNTWFERQLSFQKSSMSDDNTLLLMRILFRNLLKIKVDGWDEMIEYIIGEEETPAKWFFHWIASLYQRPGRSLSTTLWIIGLAQGTGKGLFCEMMRGLLGRSNVYDANNKELRGEWNDFLGHVSLVIGDEMTFDSKKDFYDMLKRYVSASEIALRKRNVGQYMAPCVGNWLFTTNNSRPVTIDEGDRRNTFIATTEEESEARELSSQFYRLSGAEKQLAYEGIAEVLSIIEIDDDLIRYATMTPIKAEIMGLSQSPLMRWLSTASKYYWKVGDFQASDRIYAEFRQWGSDNHIYVGQLSRTQFDMQIGDAGKRGLVLKARKRIDGVLHRGYQLLKFPPHGFYDDEKDLGVEETTHLQKVKTNIDKAKGRRP